MRGGEKEALLQKGSSPDSSSLPPLPQGHSHENRHRHSGPAGIKPPALQNLAEPARPARHRLGWWAVGAALGAADDLVVALPDTRRDEVLARHLRAQGVNTFRGSEQDVLSRMHGAAAAHGADLVVRVCADNPLIWGGEIDNLIRFYQREHTAGNCDYAYNHIPRNNLYPDGLGAEIVSFELFTKAMNEATLPAHREHCLSYIVDNPELFAIRTFDPLDPALHHPEMKLDMDTADDFINLALRDIRPDITPREIVELFR